MSSFTWCSNGQSPTKSGTRNVCGVGLGVGVAEIVISSVREGMQLSLDAAESRGREMGADKSSSQGKTFIPPAYAQRVGAAAVHPRCLAT